MSDQTSDHMARKYPKVEQARMWFLSVSMTYRSGEFERGYRSAAHIADKYFEAAITEIMEERE